MKSTASLHHYLTYAGTIPFLVCSALLAASVKILPFIGATDRVLSVYGLVIVCFMAGVHWGQHLGRDDRWTVILPLVSNAVAIIMWVSYLTCAFQTLVFAFITGFIALLAVDHCLYKEQIITARYFKTRVIVTSIVLVSLGIAVGAG